MPNFNSRYLGYNGQGYLTENLPNIAGTVEYGITLRGDGIFSGAFYLLQNGNNANTGGGSGGLKKFGFDASRSNNKYTSTNEVRPLTTRANMIIKY